MANIGSLAGNARPGLGMPITTMAVSVLNAQVDRERFFKKNSGAEVVYAHDNDNASYGVTKHELVFAGPSASRKLNYGNINDPPLRVFSSMNGYNTADKRVFLHIATAKSRTASDETRKKAEAEVEKLLYKELRFIGMSNTAYENPSSTLSNHCSVTIGGLVTIFNSGNRTINIGDRVVWRLPPVVGSREDHVQPKGLPPRKLLMQTVPFEYAAKEMRDRVMNDQIVNRYVTQVQSACGTTRPGPSPKKLMQQYADDVLEMNRDVERRIIGIALKRAEPGEPFDILLRAGKTA